MIERLQTSGFHAEQAESSGQYASTSTSFGELLRQRMECVGTAPTTQTSGIAFSKHAQQRVEERGIQVDETLLAQLSDSVQRAQAKGAKQILAFDAGRAFIINVAQNRVVTAISGEEMQENVFTNIDGAVLLK